MDPLIRSISGLRGIAGTSFNNNILITHINAFLSMQKKGTILIARDGRPHGINYIETCSEAIRRAGFNVVDCGIIPTPTAQFLVQEKKYSGGLLLTASHNPTEWNGLKFLDEGGCFVNPKKTQLIMDKADEKVSIDSKSIGEFSNNKNLWEEHLEHTLNISCIDVELIKSKRFKVVVDAVNCAGSEIIPKLLKELNCVVVKINCSSNGEFVRGAEPIPENLSQLSQRVILEKADFGLATDPDADRLAIVNENGKPLGEEYTLAIAIDGFLQTTKNKRPVVVNLSTSKLSEFSCKKHNVEIIRAKVGEINVVEEMKSLNSEIGGEGNGGVILKESHLGRDSVVATALVLNQFANQNISVSEICKTFPTYKLVKDKVSIYGLDADLILEQIENNFMNAEIDKRDGIKLTWKDKWIHIRKSNTEPIIRIYAEAESFNNISSKIKLIKKNIEDSRG
ncbi:MAG: phosphoglucosamine mutase [Candidatus Marinimicrobia bacterium]|nr:phosphoglucosamine mutase [Candidatus Neomarinimicrobiota bacterium]|tara:strand:+ start:1282 stop:2637 length:1356 start_codon:yes stop_codon:yes gene_type:complete